MLLKANRAINSMQKHIESMMKISAPYGKGMGAMGTLPFNSAGGAGFAHKTASMMNQNPKAAEGMLSSIMRKAEGSGMSPAHMERMSELQDRVRGVVPNLKSGGASTLNWI